MGGGAALRVLRVRLPGEEAVKGQDALEARGGGREVTEVPWAGEAAAAGRAGGGPVVVRKQVLKERLAVGWGHGAFCAGAGRCLGGSEGWGQVTLGCRGFVFLERGMVAFLH